ncbi:hypothetical protein COU76_00290 [Candidatus Peregrinibacteria bacterium CG10_big_fil_rev_8_21_14_0_10_49_10]|nr:MAG: hypothetical protein COU76_00290 [Candidatus Peregrinibacteria bacterium CG10_big_fil_rev_8_21_14_0_10_49_10]
MYLQQAQPYNRRRPEKRKESTGETGHTFEESYLYTAEEVRVLGLHTEHPDIPKDLTFRGAIKYCIARSPLRYDPKNVSDPQSRRMNTVHLSIRDTLGCPNNHVQMFPSIQTAADQKGCDFFVVHEDAKTGKEFLVTADITENKEKIEKADFRADVLVTPRGCIANPKYYKDLLPKGEGIGYFLKEDTGNYFADIDARALGTGRVIANVFREKIKAIDTDIPHPNPLHYIYESERAAIGKLLSHITPPQPS